MASPSKSRPPARMIVKRDGRHMPYDENKIAAAIGKAMHAAGHDNPAAAVRLAAEAGRALHARGDADGHRIEDIQDVVEKVLMHADYPDAAKQFILHRAQRTRIREANTGLMRVLNEITHTDARASDLKRDNANIDGNTAMGSMLQIGSAAAKVYNAAHLLADEHEHAHREGLIHIHDFDFYALTTTCCQIDLDRLFENGFSTGHGHLREPQDIQSYAALACIAIQSNQNDQHGGQSVPNFDYALAKGVAKTYRRLFGERLKQAVALLAPGHEDAVAGHVDAFRARVGRDPSLDTDPATLRALAEALDLPGDTGTRAVDFAANAARAETERRTYQAMEALIHNLNSMHSRAGAQTPFSSINYGTDTSPEGRMVVRAVLAATESGLGRGETPIFPIQVFKLKRGVNYDPGDPNHDLFEQACHCSARRLFPNFVNIDAPFNLPYYQPGRPETEVTAMGCRTRILSNRHDPSRETVFGRGNLSFTSINLPRLALEAKGDEDAFFRALDWTMELVIEQLLDRFEIQARKKVRNFPFLMGEGVWLDSERLGPDDEIREVLKHGSLTMGFIGLAEALTALYGRHHGECDEIQQKGLAIVRRMHAFTQRQSEIMAMNFTLLATPAEGLAGRFLRKDRRRYGTRPGVTDRDYYTNSFHIPVHYPISAWDKINKEAPYHALTPGGHITYVEMDGAAVDNPEAFMTLIRAMHDAGAGYFSINHPVDRDPVCGYVGIIKDTCPRCGRREGEPISTGI